MDELNGIAKHEAGHAAVLDALGLSVTIAITKTANGYIGRAIPSSPPSTADDAVVACAGVVSEHAWAPIECVQRIFLDLVGRETWYFEDSDLGRSIKNSHEDAQILQEFDEAHRIQFFNQAIEIVQRRERWIDELSEAIVNSREFYDKIQLTYH